MSVAWIFPFIVVPAAVVAVLGAFTLVLGYVDRPRGDADRVEPATHAP